MKYQLITCLAASLLSLSACSSSNNDFDATGTFEATEVMVSSQSIGQILTLDAEEGVALSALQEVGVIDTIQLYLSKMQLLKSSSSVRAASPAVKTQVASLKEQIAKQETELARVQRLLQAGAATQKQLDDISSNISVLKSQLTALQSTLQKNVSSIDDQASAIDIQVAQIEDKLHKCHIVAPMSGIVLEKYAEAGELASIGRPLFKLADLNHIYLRAYVTSGQLAHIKIGQNVMVTADYGGDKQQMYEGVISWISSKSEFTPKSIQTRDDRENMVYAIKISVKNDGNLKIGMYGEVKF